MEGLCVFVCMHESVLVFICVCVCVMQLAYDSMHPDIQVETKASATDLVTAADKAVEEFILSSLSKKFPSHK